MFKGIYNPCITPLQENGSIDFEGLAQHISHLIEAKINGILFFGSIGEFYSFSLSEKKALVDFAVPYIKNRTKTLIGIGSNNIDETIELGNYAKEKGASGVVVISPYYFGPSDEAAKEYFTQIAQNVDLPIMLYNFPARTGNDLSPSLIEYLAKTCKNIVAVKDTVDNISHTRKIIEKVKKVREDFCVLSGFDEYYVANRIAGGDGVLCGLTNVAPEIFIKLHETYEEKNFQNVEKFANQVSRLMALYDTTDLFVSGIKIATQKMGLNIKTSIRKPFVKATLAQEQMIEKILKEVLQS